MHDSRRRTPADCATGFRRRVRSSESVWQCQPDSEDSAARRPAADRLDSDRRPLRLSGFLAQLSRELTGKRVRMLTGRSRGKERTGYFRDSVALSWCTSQVKTSLPRPSARHFL